MNFRYARHTNNLKPLIEFYTNVLGLEILGSFENHDKYNGVFLGKQDLDWHLEFTESDEKANHQPDRDDLLVFYLNTTDELTDVKTKVECYGHTLVESKNPYWKQHGIEITDPDGFGVIAALKRNS